MTPIGRGQRQADHRRPQDRQDDCSASTPSSTSARTGRRVTSASRWRCVYVAIGQKGTTIASVRRVLEEGGAMDYTTIVAAPASDAAGLQMACAIYRFGDRSALDVSGQACADRLRRPDQAGRGVPRDLAAAAPARPVAKPIPVTSSYLHSRLLERCGKLSDELGAGSLTGLPIIETKANDISAYNPDQRHLDHRRAVLPGDRPVQPGCPAGHQRRRLGVPGRRRRADQGNERGGRKSPFGPVAVPRTGILRGLCF